MDLQAVDASASPEVQMNDNMEALNWAAVFAKNALTTSGMNWGYLGGRWAGFPITAGILALAATATNYMVVARATGVVSISSVITNWNDTTNYARAYKLTTAGSVLTVIEDHRAGLFGTFVGTPAAAGTAGRHAIPMLASSMQPSFTGGCAALARLASAANQPDIVTLDFDPTTQEYAQFSVPMPKSWNEGTVTFKPIWSHASTTTNFGVVWDLQAVAVGDNESIAQAFGTAIKSTDVGGVTNNAYTGPESTAITIAGSPVAEDLVFFRLSRVAADGSDTLAIDARLHGLVLYITTDAENDA